MIRISKLLDKDSFQEMFASLESHDPLDFADTKSYADD